MDIATLIISIASIILAVISGVCSILLLTGNGKFVLTLFQSKSKQAEPLPYDEKKYTMAMGIACIPICLSSLAMVFFPENLVIVIAGLVLVVLVWAGAIFYLRKYAKVETKKESINKKVRNLQRKK